MSNAFAFPSPVQPMLTVRVENLARTRCVCRFAATIKNARSTRNAWTRTACSRVASTTIASSDTFACITNASLAVTPTRIAAAASRVSTTNARTLAKRIPVDQTRCAPCRTSERVAHAQAVWCRVQRPRSAVLDRRRFHVRRTAIAVKAQLASMSSVDQFVPTMADA